MKKKILVPIMALALAVTAGVNYSMTNSDDHSTKLSLSLLIKSAFADNTEISTCNGDGSCDWDYCSLCNSIRQTYGESDETCSVCGADMMMCDYS